MFSAIEYSPGNLKLIDQTKLPLVEHWYESCNLEKTAEAIEQMVVRGAPAIGCTAAFGMHLDSLNTSALTWGEYLTGFKQAIERLRITRPTAVNLFYALDRFENLVASWSELMPISQVREEFFTLANWMFEDDIRTCRAIGENGLGVSSKDNLRIITHCNTGSLATAGYGTALGVIRSLHQAGRVEMVYVDETRPFLQGARLTAYELQKDGIPYQLISDNAAAWTIKTQGVDFAVVGADRIAESGDTANKIGTYNLAINCRHHGIDFFVAAPYSTVDLETKSGNDIVIEQRPKEEVLTACGHPIAPPEAQVYNPSFDVTPAELISGIITEKGLFRAPYAEVLRRHF